MMSRNLETLNHTNENSPGNAFPGLLDQPNVCGADGYRSSRDGPASSALSSRAFRFPCGSRKILS